MLKLGIDQVSLLYRCQGRVWGSFPTVCVIHDCMSPAMYNYQYGLFLGNMKDSLTDPFNHHIFLDYFDRYHLECNLYYYEKGL